MKKQYDLDDEHLNKILEILEKTNYFVAEVIHSKNPRKNCLGRMLGIDIWIRKK